MYLQNMENNVTIIVLTFRMVLDYVSLKKVYYDANYKFKKEKRTF